MNNCMTTLAGDIKKYDLSLSITKKWPKPTMDTGLVTALWPMSNS